MSATPPSSVPPSYPPPGGGGYTPPPLPPGGGAAPGSDRTIMLVLSYLGILALIPLLTKKDDSEVQWHAKNGLAFTVAFVAFFIIWQVISYFLPTIACVMTVVPCAVSIAWIAVTIMGIMKATQGQRFRLPVLSDFADKM